MDTYDKNCFNNCVVKLIYYKNKTGLCFNNKKILGQTTQILDLQTLS